MVTREKRSVRMGDRQQVPFAQVAPVFRAALLLGAGGGFLLACVLTVTSMSGILLIACSLGGLELAGIVNLVNLWQTQTLVPAMGDQLFVTLGVFGFLLPMALGMSARSLPMYAELDAFPSRQLLSLAFAYIAGLLLFCAGTLINWLAIEGAGMILVGGVLIGFVLLFLRTMRSRGTLPRNVKRLAPEPERVARAYRARVAQERSAYGPFVALVASAYLWAVLSGILLLIDGLTELLGWSEPFVEDAIRHGLTVGFISLLICGLAPRMLPGFSGGTIRSAKLVSATLWLGNLAALLRVGLLLLAPLLTIGNLNLSQVAFGCSGILGLALAICLAINLWPALRPAQT